MNDKDWFKNATLFFERALKLKAKMVSRTPVLTFAQTTCTINGCDGALHVRLRPYRLSHPEPIFRYHMGAYCTKCSNQAME